MFACVNDFHDFVLRGGRRCVEYQIAENSSADDIVVEGLALKIEAKVIRAKSIVFKACFLRDRQRDGSHEGTRRTFAHSHVLSGIWVSMLI